MHMRHEVQSPKIVLTVSKKGPNNSHDHVMLMISPRQFHNEQIRKKIDQLLDSSVDLDQIAVLMAQMPDEFEEIGINSLASQKIVYCAMENAKKIQEARKLILAMR